MLVIGLTGSIATGKSTVSSALGGAPHAIPVIDADKLARDVVEPGTRAYAQIVAYFGPTTPDLLLPSPTSPPPPPSSDGGSGSPTPPLPPPPPLNRPALGRRVFGDSQERRRDRAVLNSIVHPAVRAAMLRRLLRLYASGHWAVVLDVPLLFEASMHLWCGAIIVVAVADPDVQARRLLARDAANGLTPEDARNRIASQTDVRVKAERCAELGPDRGIVLWNDGEKEDLRRSVDDAVARLKGANPPWWHWLLLGCPPLAVVAGTLAVCRNWTASKRWQAQRKEA